MKEKKMRGCRYFAQFILLGLALGFIAVGAIGISAHKKHVEKKFEAYYDFGDVHLAQSLEHNFKIENPFRETLRITGINSSCGCTSAEPETDTIPPNTSTTLKLIMTAPSEPGETQVQTLVSATTVRNTQHAKFLFVLNVHPKNVITVHNGHPFIELGNYTDDDLPVAKTLTITKGEHPLQWDQLKCKSKDNNLKPVLMQVSPQEWELNLELTKTNSFGAVRTHLEFSFWKNGRPHMYRLLKPVQVNIAGPILTEPKSILFGAIRAGQKAQKYIRLVPTQNSTQSITILSAESTDPNKVKTKIMSHGEQQTIAVFFAPTSEEKGPCSGSIRIKAQLEKIYFIRVPYLAYVVQ